MTKWPSRDKRWNEHRRELWRSVHAELIPLTNARQLKALEKYWLTGKEERVELWPTLSERGIPVIYRAGMLPEHSEEALVELLSGERESLSDLTSNLPITIGIAMNPPTFMDDFAPLICEWLLSLNGREPKVLALPRFEGVPASTKNRYTNEASVLGGDSALSAARVWLGRDDPATNALVRFQLDSILREASNDKWRTGDRLEDIEDVVRFAERVIASGGEHPRVGFANELKARVLAGEGPSVLAQRWREHVASA